MTDETITRLDPIEVWAKTARDYAHMEANWIDHRSDAPPSSLTEPHAEVLRYKYRLEGWTTALTIWYTVDITPRGEVWRHLSISCSQSHLGAIQAEQLQSEINASKKLLLELFEPTVRMFFPMSMKIATKFDVSTPVPVADPRLNQVTFRVPMTFHFLVPWSDKGSGPVTFEPEERKNVATTDPRILGWRLMADEPPDHDDQVLVWSPGHGFSIARYTLVSQGDDTPLGLWVFDMSKFPVPPAGSWWKKLSPAPQVTQ